MKLLKSKLIYSLLLFSLLFIITACGSQNDDSVVNDDTDLQEVTVEEVESEESNMDSTEEEVETTTADQLDLKMGDTGKFETTIATYEITLNGAELLNEFDGREPELDSFMLLDLTVKNTSDTTKDVYELVNLLEVTDFLEGSGFSDLSDFFTSIDKFEGEIEPNEEISGQIITHAEDSEQYFVVTSPGVVATGATNDVIWTFTAEETK